MKNIFSFLEKFKILKDPKKERGDIAKVISGIVGFEVDEKSLLIKEGNISIKAFGGMKSEIFLKKDLLLKTLNEKFPNLHIKNIL